MAQISAELLAKASQAKSDQVTAATELWNARLEILQDIGDLEGILNHLETPVEAAANNCGCNNGCDSTKSAPDPSMPGQ